jgi:26S proteasome regulatory subunit N11
MLRLTKLYHKNLVEDQKLTQTEKAVANVGKLDPKKHLEQKAETSMSKNIVQLLGTMIDTVIF